MLTIVDDIMAISPASALTNEFSGGLYCRILLSNAFAEIAPCLVITYTSGSALIKD